MCVIAGHYFTTKGAQDDKDFVNYLTLGLGLLPFRSPVILELLVDFQRGWFLEL